MFFLALVFGVIFTQQQLQNGYTYREKSCQTCTCEGPSPTAFVQDWSDPLVASARPQLDQEAECSPFSGQAPHRTDQSQDDGIIRTCLEMRHLYENLWQKPPVLRSMWKIMAPLCGPYLCPGLFQHQTSPMVLCHQLERPRLGGYSLAAGAGQWGTMDGISTTTYSTEEKIEEGQTAAAGRKSKGQRQGSTEESRGGDSWPAIHGKPGGSRYTMAYQPYAAATSDTNAECDPTGRQADQNDHGRPAQAQRHLAARTAGLRVRSSSEGKPAETKQMHHAVTAHGKAKKELQQAQLARLNLHAAWRGFLGHAVNLWQGYSAQFVAQEKQMAERVTAAVDALDQAKVNLAKSKQTAGVEVKDDAMTISEDDTEKDVSGPAAEKIKQGISNLHSSLEALKSSAEQMVEEEQQALKRPRTTAFAPEPSAPNSGEMPDFG